MDFTKLFISPQSSVLHAMKLIDYGGAQIALVVDGFHRLIGTVTDGDIRRALLNGSSLDDEVCQVMNNDFRYVSGTNNVDSALKMMRQSHLHQIPVLDEKGCVIQLLLLEELIAPVELPNSVVIMAGGKGTRLLPHTQSCPKPMLLVDGKPMLEILLEQCIAAGFVKYYFSVNYLKEQIVDHFGDGRHWGVTIEYLFEDEPLGTAGSLSLLPSSVLHPFLVLNGDVLTRLNYRRLLTFHEESNAQATLCVREHETNVPFGVVQTNGIELAGFQEKPTYSYQANAGVYMISPKLLPLLQPHEYTDMPSLLQVAQESGFRVVVCPIHEYWIDVGRPETLSQAKEDWTNMVI